MRDREAVSTRSCARTHCCFATATGCCSALTVSEPPYGLLQNLANLLKQMAVTGFAVGMLLVIARGRRSVQGSVVVSRDRAMSRCRARAASAT
jgi:ribose/xylose/arabinose/galactoside ABC-type transport system permease subunit